jgi:hypothetical protein
MLLVQLLQLLLTTIADYYYCYHYYFTGSGPCLIALTVSCGSCVACCRTTDDVYVGGMVMGACGRCGSLWWASGTPVLR